MSLTALLLPLLAAAAQPPIPTQEEQRRVAEEVLGQLAADTPNPHHVRGYDGVDHVGFSSAVRAAAGGGGLCQYDGLRIARAGPDARLPAGSNNGRIREMVVRHYFYVVTDRGGPPYWEPPSAPRWDLQGAELEGRCAQIPTHRHGWFEADDAGIARSTVAGLVALKAELRRGSSSIVELRCRPFRCAPSARIAERMEVHRPTMAKRTFGDCPPGRWCIDTLIDNPDGCGAYSATLVMDGRDRMRLRQAEFDSFVGSHCGHVE